jgi:hypothetical protein
VVAFEDKEGKDRSWRIVLKNSTMVELARGFHFDIPRDGGRGRVNLPLPVAALGSALQIS